MDEQNERLKEEIISKIVGDFLKTYRTSRWHGFGGALIVIIAAISVAMTEGWFSVIFAALIAFLGILLFLQLAKKRKWSWLEVFVRENAPKHLESAGCSGLVSEKLGKEILDNLRIEFRSLDGYISLLA